MSDNNIWGQYHGLWYMFNIPAILFILFAVLSSLFINNSCKEIIKGINIFLEAKEYDTMTKNKALIAWKNMLTSIWLGGILSGTMYLTYGFSYLFKSIFDITNELKGYLMTSIFCCLLSFLYTIVLHIVFLPIYQRIRKDAL